MPHDQSGRVQKISPPPGFGPRTAQLVASRYPGPYVHITEVINLQLRDSCREKILITVRENIRFVVFFLLGDSWRLNFMRRRFGTLFSNFIGRVNKKFLFTRPTNRSAFRAQLTKCSADVSQRTGTGRVSQMRNL